MNRREMLAIPLGAARLLASARPALRVTGYELITVRATARTVWMFVRLRSDKGLTGLGEASDAYGFANTTKAQAAEFEGELRAQFGLVQGKSPFDVEAFRQAGDPRARKGLISATVHSALEQAMWDLAGQSLGVPIYDMMGGAVRTVMPMYANINRATRPRTPAGFAVSARGAVAEGFRAMKAAPFDGFPVKGSSEEIRQHVEQGIACVNAIREAIGPAVELMIDCHSFFDVPMAIDVARRLEAANLAWYEEPVAPKRVAETLEIRRAIRQRMAGGEILYAVDGFAPLCRDQAVHTIMPDPKHCGGLLELTRIAAMAGGFGVDVAPHNPSGPVSTAAAAHVCAGMKNFRILELQWGEVPWRAELLDPPERITAGRVTLGAQPGLGVKLNDRLAKQHPL